MQQRSIHVFINWRWHEVVQNLGRRADHHDLVLEYGTVLIIEVPLLAIEEFPQVNGLIGVGCAEPYQVRLQIARHIGRATNLIHHASADRFVWLLVGLRQILLQLPIGYGVARRAHLRIERIRKENYVSDPVIVHLRRRYQGAVRWDADSTEALADLRQIKIRAEHNFVAIAVKRGMKRGIVLNFLGPDRGQLERFLVDSDENKIIVRFSLASLPAKDVFVRLLAAPEDGQERNACGEMQCEHQNSDKGANARQDHQAMSA